jgi:Skp family chaperone for outer membrane proteins
MWAAMVTAVSGAWALDIPLEGGGGGAGNVLSIGYVDMERIYQLYPKTRVAKEDYSKQLRAKRAELAGKEKELLAIKNRLSVLESTLKNGGADPAAAAGAAPVDDAAIDPSLENLEAKEPAALIQLKKELEEKQADFEEQRKRAQDDLIAFERRQNQVILGNIYQALRDLAQEQQVSIVVDKTSVLYGDATIDLTDKLQDKVRGY